MAGRDNVSVTRIIASGFTDMDPEASVPTPTADKVSGLPNGTYFWRVKATQLVGGAQGVGQFRLVGGA